MTPPDKAPAYNCPPEALAEIKDEPLPPGGIPIEPVVDSLKVDGWEWFAVAHAVWGRDNAERLKRIKAQCKAAQLTP